MPEFFSVSPLDCEVSTTQTVSEFQRGYEAALEAASEFCKVGAKNNDRRASEETDPSRREIYETRADNWGIAADMIAALPMPKT